MSETTKRRVTSDRKAIQAQESQAERDLALRTEFEKIAFRELIAKAPFVTGGAGDPEEALRTYKSVINLRRVICNSAVAYAEMMMEARTRPTNEYVVRDDLTRQARNSILEKAEAIKKFESDNNFMQAE